MFRVFLTIAIVGVSFYWINSCCEDTSAIVNDLEKYSSKTVSSKEYTKNFEKRW